MLSGSGQTMLTGWLATANSEQGLVCPLVALLINSIFDVIARWQNQVV